MPLWLWIIVIGVLLLVAALLLAFWWINRAVSGQIKEAEKDETEDHPPFDIPVLRDKPKLDQRPVEKPSPKAKAE